MTLIIYFMLHKKICNILYNYQQLVQVLILPRLTDGNDNSFFVKGLKNWWGFITKENSF